MPTNARAALFNGMVGGPVVLGSVPGVTSRTPHLHRLWPFLLLWANGKS
jgi:hypothetical protein